MKGGKPKAESVVDRYGKIPGQIELLVVIGANREQRAPFI